MKRPAWGNAGAGAKAREDYHDRPAKKTVPYLEVPTGTAGLAAATEFDQCAIAVGHPSFLRRVIPGEFAPFNGDNLTRARSQGLYPAVLVTSIRAGLRMREVVTLATWPTEAEEA